MFVNPDAKTAWDNFKLQNTYGYNTFTGGSFKSRGGEVRFKSFGEHVCHAKLGKYGSCVSSDMVELWSKRVVLNNGVTKEMEWVYYPWLIKDSPWAPAFIEKDYEKCLINGFNLRTDLPNSFVASAVIATRFLTEKYDGWMKNRYSLYAKLLENKVDPLWAFLMTNFYNNRNEDAHTFSMHSGHEMLPTNLTLRSLKRFVEGDYCKTHATFRDNQGYSGVGIAWTYDDAGPELSTLAKNWAPKVVEKTDFNVFRKPDVKGGYPVLTFKDLLLVKDMIKELLNDKALAA